MMDNNIKTSGITFSNIKISGIFKAGHMHTFYRLTANTRLTIDAVLNIDNSDV